MGTWLFIVYPAYLSSTWASGIEILAAYLAYPLSIWEHGIETLSVYEVKGQISAPRKLQILKEQYQAVEAPLRALSLRIDLLVLS